MLILKFISLLSLIYYTQTIATLIDEDTSPAVSNEFLDNVPETESKLSIEAESLQKMNNFILKSVDSVLTKSLPFLIQAGLEANLSIDCTNSFIAWFQGLKSGKEWAFRCTYKQLFFNRFSFKLKPLPSKLPQFKSAN